MTGLVLELPGADFVPVGVTHSKSGIDMEVLAPLPLCHYRSLEFAQTVAVSVLVSAVSAGPERLVDLHGIGRLCRN